MSNYHVFPLIFRFIDFDIKYPIRRAVGSEHGCLYYVGRHQPPYEIRIKYCSSSWSGFLALCSTLTQDRIQLVVSWRTLRSRQVRHKRVLTVTRRRVNLVETITVTLRLTSRFIGRVYTLRTRNVARAGLRIYRRDVLQ